MRASNADQADMLFVVKRAEFFAVGRAFQRGIGKKILGRVKIVARPNCMTVSSEWGSCAMTCEGFGEICAEVAARAFCSLITTRYRQVAPAGRMQVIFRPSCGEVAIDRAGVKATFPVGQQLRS